MNLNGNLPRLTDADSLYATKTYSEVMADRLEGGSWTDLSLNTGWQAVPGYTPQIRKYGRLVELRGMIHFVSGVYTNSVTTLPSKFRPVGQTIILPPSMGRTSKAFVHFFVFTNGSIAVPGTDYISKAMTGGDYLPLRGMWSADGV